MATSIPVCHLNDFSTVLSHSDDGVVTLEFEAAEMMDLQEYSTSSIWDITGAPATKVADRSRIEYQLHLR